MAKKILSANQNWRFYRGNPASRRDEVQRSNAKKPWDIDYNDENWELVCLPHTVRNEALMCSGGLNYQGPAWYRKKFILSKEDVAGDLLFEFEGAMQRVDAWLDGEALAYFEGGFLPIALDLSGKLKADKVHLLVLRVDNSDMPDVPPGKSQGALDFCYFGGLYRDANLYISNKVRFSHPVHEGIPASGGIFVNYGDVSSNKALVRVKSHLLNRDEKSANAKLEILLNGEKVSESKKFQIEAGKDHEEKLEFTVNNPKLWHPYSPNLYDLIVNLLNEKNEILDSISERIGIRSVKFTPEGFFINGEKLFLAGANRHQEYAYAGFALPDSIQRRDAEIMRKAGIICVRTAHYPQDRSFMKACDELGIICIIPTPGWQIHPDSVKFDLLSYDMTRAMIRMNRNHPSAVLWEPILNETDYPEYYAKKQLQIVREEMEDENALAACDGHYSYAEFYPVNYGRNAKEGRAVFNREYGDAYIEQFGPMSTLRRVRRGEDISFYLGGEKPMIRSADERFEAYKAQINLKGLSGAAIWAAIDHNRGYEDNEAAVGMWDWLRLPKFFYHMYDTQQDPKRAGVKCFIANFWKEDSPRDVTVYSNGERVKLSLNGREIETKEGEKSKGDKSDEIYTPLVFENVPREEGELRADAFIGTTITASHIVRTPLNAIKLVLVPHWANNEHWTADGSDLLMVHVHAVDKNGTTNPWEKSEVHFTLSDGAFIVGEGEDWVGSNPVKLEAGSSGVLLRAGTEPKTIILKAKADGLEAAEIKLELEEDKKPRLNSPPEKAPVNKPVYASDSQKIFTQRQSLKLEDWYKFDMAKGKPASASSFMEGHEPSNAAKGRIGEPWIASNSESPQWWLCDMEEVCAIYGTTISWMDDGLWYEYDIETSVDGQKWEKITENRASGQTRKPDRFPDTVEARYVKVNIYSVSGGNKAGIYLVEIHANKERRY